MKATDIDTGLTRDVLIAKLDVYPETGLFVWKKQQDSKFNTMAGKPAGSTRGRAQYVAIYIDGRHYFAHRLMWLYVHGEWPREHIDHIDGNKKNNRITNLREATNSQNKSNGKLYKHSTSGLKGVSKVGKKWKAQIVHGYQNIYLGCHNTKEEAHEAYLKAASDLQGEFARAA